MERAKSSVNVKSLLMHSSIFLLSFSIASLISYRYVFGLSSEKNLPVWSPKVGETLKPGRVKTLSGSELDLQSYHPKALLLVVFSTSCSACSMALDQTWPKIVGSLDMAKILPVFVTASDRASKVEKFLAGKTLDVPIAIAEKGTEMHGLLSRVSLPCYLIIKDNVILGVWQGQPLTESGKQERLQAIAETVSQIK